MIVQCEHCRTKFRLADDRVTGRGVKVRCSKCAHVFTVHGGADPAPRVDASMIDPSSIGAASSRPSGPPTIMRQRPARPMPSVPPAPNPIPSMPAPASHLPGRSSPSGDFSSAIDDLMLPGANSLGGSAPTGRAGLDLSPSALGGPSGFGGSPPTGMASPFGSLGLSAKPFLPESAWLAAASPPAPSPLSGTLPRLPFDPGGTKTPGVRSPLPSIPAGRPPPGHAMPSVPRALLEAHGELDPGTSGRLRALADIDSSGVDGVSFEGETTIEERDPFAAIAASASAKDGQSRSPSMELSRPPSMELSRPPSMELSRPPSMELPRPPTMELSRPETLEMFKPDLGQLLPSFEPPKGRPSAHLPPRQSWNLSFEPDNSNGGPPVSSSQSIRVPTFPPPPVFDPFLDAPKSLPPPSPSPSPPPPPPPAPAKGPSDDHSDQFMLGNRNEDPFAGLADAFGPDRTVAYPDDIDVGEIQPVNEKPAKPLARLELRKGLLDKAGVVTLGRAEADTRMDPPSVADQKVPSRRSNIRTAALTLVLLGLGTFAVVTERSSHETRVGGISLFDPKSLVPGAIAAVETEQARVTAYPLRAPNPRLVVSGMAVNRGEPLGDDVEVVALMLDGDRVVEQRQSPLGVLPLDALAEASTAVEVDVAWSKAERKSGPWGTGERRSFMVVFPDVPTEIQDYTFRVEFRRATSAAAP